MIADCYDVRACQADRLEFAVPTPIAVEGGHAYACRQYGQTSVAPLVVCVKVAGTLHSLAPTYSGPAGTEAVYADDTLAPGLTVSYFVRNTAGAAVRGTLASYSSVALESGGAGYVRIDVPLTLPDGHRIVLRTPAPSSNEVALTLRDAAPRVRAGDYVWVEVAQEKKTSAGWSRTEEAIEGVAVERLGLSLDLQTDPARPAADLF